MDPAVGEVSPCPDRVSVEVNRADTLSANDERFSRDCRRSPHRFIVTRIGDAATPTTCESVQDDASITLTPPQVTLTPPQVTLTPSTPMTSCSHLPGQPVASSTPLAFPAPCDLTRGDPSDGLGHFRTVCGSPLCGQLWQRGALHPSMYSPNQTISYGHTDGRNLVIRRMLDWQQPNLHVVRKYSSACASESSSTVSAVPTHRERWPHKHRRATWTNKTEFLLACLGYSVGLGNLWRFPYVCYKSGGGAFLVPYYLMMMLCSVPLLLMELTVGQFTRRGPLDSMARLCPLLKGAGLASVVLSFLFCSYYNVVIAWALYYLVVSFRNELPWRGCNNTWSTSTCQMHPNSNITSLSGNATSPSQDYFYHGVLRISGGIEEPGALNWPLVLTLLLAWMLVYFSLWKSIKSSGKVVYLTVLAPYVLLGVFLWRAVTLEGASEGLRFLFEPHWELLLQAKVWVNAAAQNFNSIGIAFGSMMVFSSYNRFESRSLLTDTLVICSVNSFTSILAGIIVFATLGNISHELGQNIEDVITAGPGLVFVIYPKALAELPMSQLWSVMFFFMLLCLGLDSQFATLEVVITTVQDCYGRLIRRYLRHHELLVLAICAICFLLGIPHITQGGMYFFQLMDHYVADIAVLLVALFEVVAITWVYGSDRLSEDFERMTGHMPSIFFRVSWRLMAPFLILVILVFSVVDHNRLTYGSYRYPDWAVALGWTLTATCVLPIPVLALLVLYRAKGDTLLQKYRSSIEPDRSVVPEDWFEPTVDGPNDPQTLSAALCELHEPQSISAALCELGSLNGQTCNARH